jgi:mitochondrial ATPase complex subunit ATP10
VLAGRVSVVSVFSGQWAEGQVKTFASPDGHPELEAALAAAGPARAQHVRLNVEEDGLKAALIRLFLGRLRRSVGGPDAWDKYFVVRRGLTREIREAIGLLNSKVGYVYLVDAECRIRWAGSGNAEDHEKVSMVKALQRLLEEDAARVAKVEEAAKAAEAASKTAKTEKKKV